jgi:hypothetical protein
MAVLLDKLKEKDRRVIEAVHTTLDVMLSSCISLDACVEDLVTALGPKGVTKAKVRCSMLIHSAAWHPTSVQYVTNLLLLLWLAA